MTPERSIQPAPKRPYEVFGITEQECQDWSLSQERFEEILGDEKTVIHEIKPSLNEFGEFLSVTTSRPGDRTRIGMTFHGLGYHEQRQQWITEEWFWDQTELHPDLSKQKIDKDKAHELLKQRREKIAALIGRDALADPTKQTENPAASTGDTNLEEDPDLDSLNAWLSELDQNQPPEEPPPNGAFLLDEESRQKLPPLYSGEELGMDAMAQVKFFTPDSNWTWYASEFDGEDIFFGLVSGLDVELGYFSLKELQEVRGPLGILIERDIHFQPKKLGELMKLHRQDAPPTLDSRERESDQAALTFEEVVSGAKENMLRDGRHVPTLILVSGKNIVIGQIPEMPATREKRIDLMYFLGEVTVKEGKIDPLRQAFLISEGWMNMASPDKQAQVPPSMDPERKEVLIVSSVDIGENKKRLKLFEILRESDERVMGLEEFLPEGQKDESVEIPLLEAFVRGYQLAYRTKYN